MKKLLCIIIVLLISSAWAGKIEIASIEKLSLLGEKNYRNVRLSPNGRFLAFEILENKSYLQYIYDLQTKEYVKIGKPLDTGNAGFLSGMGSRSTEITNQLTWGYNPIKKYLYFDLIHAPFPGAYQLFRSRINMKRVDLSVFGTTELLKNKYFKTYKNLEEYRVTYPSSGYQMHGANKNIMWVVLSLDKQLAVFDHSSIGKPTLLTEKNPRYGDLFGKFSHNDARIVFSRDYQTKCDIGLIEYLGEEKWSQPKMLVQTNYIDVSPEWSPDDRRIAYYSDKGHPKQFGIWIYDFTTGKTREVVSNVNRNDERHKGPNWLGNNGLIYVKRDITLKDPIAFMDLRDGTETILSTETASNQDISVVSLGMTEMGDEEFLVAFTSRGDIGTRDDLIWTKIYIMKLRIQ